MAAESSELKQLVQKRVEEKKKENFYDKVFNLMLSKVIIVGQNGLEEFPKLVCRPG